MTSSRHLIDHLNRAAAHQPVTEPTSKLNRQNEHWVDYAACAHSPDPEAWWPKPQIWRAPPNVSRICGGCPARWQCLHHALNHDESGVWGGFTEIERKHLNAQTRALIGKLARQPIGSAAAAI